MRLDAMLSHAGVGSRKEVQRLIKSRKVKVNNEVEVNISKNVNETDIISVDNKQINTEKYIYLMLNKPIGYTCTTELTEDSVMNIIPSEYKKKGLSPVGRLDKDSEGLLLLSNDGDFIHKILSPKKHLQKTYFVQLKYSIKDEDILAFKEGITLADGTKCLPAILEYTENENEAIVKITEGKYHQVRRMMAARDNFVEKLIRLKIGYYSLGNIRPGEIVKFYLEEK